MVRRSIPAVPKINWSHPLTKGLVAAYVFVNAGRIIDLTGRGHHSTITSGDPAVVPTRQGLAVHLDATSDSFSVPDASELDVNVENFTLAIGITPQQAGSTGTEFVEKQVTNDVWQFRINGADNFEFFVKDGATIRTVEISGSYSANQYYNIICRKSLSANTIAIFADAVLGQSTTDDTTGIWSSSSPMLIGGGNGGNPDAFYHYLYIWKDAKSDAEILSLHRDPYQIFKPLIIHVSLIDEVEQFGPATTVFITSVDGDDAWADGDTGMPIIGTGFV